MRYLSLIVGGLLVVVAAPSVAAQKPHVTHTAPHRTPAAADFDRLGMRVFAAEWDAYLLAGTTLYGDPEDAEGDEHTYFQSSLKLLGLALLADSMDASAQYHYGAVLARKSYSGFGDWDVDTLRVAVAHLTRARALLTNVRSPLRDSVETDWKREQGNLSAVEHQ